MRDNDVQPPVTDVALLCKDSHESGTRVGLFLPSGGLYYRLMTISHVLSNDT